MPSLSCRLSGAVDLSTGRATELAVTAGKLADSSAAHADFQLDGSIVFPGLINSHDHLAFNLYPPLGRPPYTDYVEWGLDIQDRHRDEIRRIEAIPLALRTQWGELKNLLHGVTTVADHEARMAPLRIVDRVPDFQYLHSLAFHRRWWWQLNKVWLNQSVVVHLGEGTSSRVSGEIQRLVRANLARRKVIAVHGITMTAELARHFAALVWCPASNHWLYGRSAAVAELNEQVPILFGTDSTLTAQQGFLGQLRFARAQAQLTDEALFAAITQRAAELWGMNGCGDLIEGNRADLVVARRLDGDLWDSFFALQPEDLWLVLKNGRPVLVDEQYHGHPLLAPYREHLFPLTLATGRTKWVPVDVAELLARTQGYDAPVTLPIALQSS